MNKNQDTKQYTQSSFTKKMLTTLSEAWIAGEKLSGNTTYIFLTTIKWCSHRDRSPFGHDARCSMNDTVPEDKDPAFTTLSGQFASRHDASSDVDQPARRPGCQNARGSAIQCHAFSDQLFGLVSVSSTRRFCNLPCGVSFEAIGLVSPKP